MPHLEYWQIGLRTLQATNYLQAEPDLAVALAALMQPGPDGKPGLKIAILRRLQSSDLDEARVFLLVNAVETYLVLNEEEEAALRAQLRTEADQTVEATELTWADNILERGRAQGIERGALANNREMVLELVRTRLGQEPPAVQAQLAAADAATLDRLFHQAALASDMEAFLRAI